MDGLSLRAKKDKRNRILGNIYSFLVYAVLYIPVAVMMAFSFNNQRYNYYWNGFTTPRSILFSGHNMAHLAQYRSFFPYQIFSAPWECTFSARFRPYSFLCSFTDTHNTFLLFQQFQIHSF